MMKRISFLFLVVLLSLNFIACDRGIESSNKNEKIIETIVTHANFIKYDSEAELYNDAELIVIAKANREFMDREHVIKYAYRDSEEEKYLPKSIEDFYTKTSIHIIEVLKQPPSLPISKSDEVTIIEPLSLFEDNGLKKITIENYLEIKENTNYILYLKKNTYGQYGVINMNTGRFNLEFNEESMESAKYGDEESEDKHQKIKKSVVNRFQKEIKQINKYSN